MEILGIGVWELVAILIIMLVVAGPKRMIQWAYVMGTYVAKVRTMWAETMSLVQQEFNQAGVDIQLPKDIPTRQNLSKEISKQVQKTMSPITQPVQESLDEVKQMGKEIKGTPAAADSNGHKVKPAEPPASSDNNQSGFGSWSGSSPQDE